MDPISIGNLIASLRKKQGITQAEFARRLNVSNKAVSRWENGLGYPEVTQFPVIAAMFGVTVDYLMTGQRKGITVAGNILTDIVKTVECFPKVGMLANITDVTKAVGGCVPNTAIDLAKMDRNMPVSVIGKIGEDEYGRFLIAQLSRYGIDCSRLAISHDKPTSFSDVISQPSGERTFFHSRGANASFSPEDIDIASLNCVILHIGYILLLDEFDREDPEYGTVMARFLHGVRQAGIKTSIDVVSDSTADYKAKILPALKYCDYVVMNELESSMLSDLPPYRPDGGLDLPNIRETMKMMARQGVREKVIVHCKQAGFCYDITTDRFTAIGSLRIPGGEILGSVGAGDAFCAGALYGIYHNYSDAQMLEYASAAAACSLFAENSVDGMRSKTEINKLAGKYGRMEVSEHGGRT